MKKLTKTFFYLLTLTPFLCNSLLAQDRSLQTAVELADEASSKISKIGDAPTPCEQNVKMIDNVDHVSGQGCDALKKYKPTPCQEMTDKIRSQLMSLADPKKFSGTQYTQAPTHFSTSPEGRRLVDIEKNSDCSHFTNEIYRRAGLVCPYSPTASFSCLKNVFEKISESEAMPGDIVLFKGHIGLLESKGHVISATTRGGAAKREPGTKGFKQSITLNPVSDFEVKGFKTTYYRWSCPK